MITRGEILYMEKIYILTILFVICSRYNVIYTSVREASLSEESVKKKDKILR